jgi:uncharacterized protein (TIGR02284 family)
LNRLIKAGRNEVMALEAAADIVDGAERRARIREQVGRRLIFQRDVARAVVALGGVPATRGSGIARLTAAARGIRKLLIGAHEGDAYAVCARAAEKTAAAYAEALATALPADVRFGVERQYAEIECDRSELRRLRGVRARVRCRANASSPSSKARTHTRVASSMTNVRSKIGAKTAARPTAASTRFLNNAWRAHCNNASSPA